MPITTDGLSFRQKKQHLVIKAGQADYKIRFPTGMLQYSFCYVTNILLPLVNKGIQCFPQNVLSHNVSLHLLPSISLHVNLPHGDLKRLSTKSPVFIKSRILGNSSTAKAKECTFSQFDSSGKSLRLTACLSNRWKKSHIWPHRKKFLASFGL